MNPLQIVNVILGVLGNSEGLVRSVLAAIGVSDKAEPWTALGFVGVKFLQESIAVSGDPDKLKELLTRSPRDVWGSAKSIEVEVALLKEAQRAKLPAI